VHAGRDTLADIVDKVHAGERLGVEDGLRLYATPDIHTLGELANFVREKLHGRRTCYNVNLHINYTNYCVLRCKFCSFRRSYPVTDSDAPSEGGYELGVEQIVERARWAVRQGATEVHITGGLHPRLPFTYYLGMCGRIRQACPSLHIKAFTAIEIIHFARIARPPLTVRQVLGRLVEAGLDSLPGGGAEIFDARVHDEVFENKVGQAGWFEVHRAAHELGVFTNATMLYGHVEGREERLNHLVKLRAHQDWAIDHAPARFNCFVPLPFIPDRSALAHLPGPTGLEDLRTLAIARLMLDNVPHVKAFWVMYTPKLAQVSIDWGVDDVDGTVMRYEITREGGRAVDDQALSTAQLRRMIREAGGEPVERDSRYRPIARGSSDRCVGRTAGVNQRTDTDV